jgi:hypothetical protein
VTAEAGKDLVLDLTANRRSSATLGAPLTVNIGSLRAGDDVDLVLNDSKEGNDEGTLGNIIVRDLGLTPVTATYREHFRPDVTLTNLANILRAFGTVTQKLDSTYNFAEVRAGRRHRHRSRHHDRRLRRAAGQQHHGAQRHRVRSTTPRSPRSRRRRSTSRSTPTSRRPSLTSPPAWPWRRRPTASR